MVKNEICLYGVVISPYGMNVCLHLLQYFLSPVSYNCHNNIISYRNN